MADDNLTPDPAQATAGDSGGEAPKPQRKVYESTLLPRRKRRRISPWVAAPASLLILGGLFYLVRIAQTPHRTVATAGQIVYASDQGSPGVFHLWTQSQDGTGAKEITSGTLSDTAPVFTPDGSAIMFLSNRSNSQTQLFQIDADGQNLAPLTRNAGAKTTPAFAPDDRSLLSYTAGGVLFTMHLGSTGSDEADRILPPQKQHQAGGMDQGDQTAADISIPTYAWAAAGSLGKPGLAAVEETQGVQALAVVPTWDADPIDHSGDDQRPVPLLAADSLSLAWSPDGATLAAAALNVKGAPRPLSGILFFDRQGKLIQRPPLGSVSDAVTGPQNPAYTPDGQQIVFELWHQPDLASRKRLGIFAAPADGSGPPHALYQGDAESPQVTRDGQWVFFLTPRPDGSHDLCRVSLTGGPSTFQKITTGAGDIAGFSLSPQTSKAGG